MKQNTNPSIYLYNLIKKRINLAEFLESEIGCQLYWSNDETSAKLICPMPDHKDGNASFHINYFEDSGVWIYHCFGCGKKGTIIDFCEQYYGLENSFASVVWICNKFGFKESKDLVIDGLKDVKKRINIQKKIEYENMVVSNSCRMLLRKDFENNSKFVAKAYSRLNKALEQEDMELIKNIGIEVSQRMLEG
jgi:hypothetical protein